MRRLDELARYSDDPDQLTRLYLSPAHKAAAAHVHAWMEEAGLTTRIDAVGNVVGRYEGIDPNAPTLLIGSHIDTVRNAGKYDGALGVIVAIEAIAELQAKQERMPFPIEVIAFGDEEGVRFPVTLTGSKAVSGTLAAAARRREMPKDSAFAKRLQRSGVRPMCRALHANRRTSAAISKFISSRVRCARPETCLSVLSRQSREQAASRSSSAARPVMPGRCRWLCAGMPPRPRQK